MRASGRAAAQQRGAAQRQCAPRAARRNLVIAAARTIAPDVDPYLYPQHIRLHKHIPDSIYVRPPEAHVASCVSNKDRDPDRSTAQRVLCGERGFTDLSRAALTSPGPRARP